MLLPRRARPLRPPRRLLGLLLGLLLAQAWLPSGAAAYEEQTLLGLDLSWGLAPSSASMPAHGLGLGLSLDWGLGDTLSLQGRVAYAIHPAAAPGHALGAGLELIYLLDILQVVPFFGIGLDALLSARSGEIAAAPALHLLFGLDYLLDRRWIVGLDIRPHFVPLAFADPGLDPFYLTVGLRLSRVFERF